MKVVWRLAQHSPILGQAASSQTVVRRCLRKTPRVASKACAPGALTRIHGGLGRTGVSGSRAFSGWRGRIFPTFRLSRTVTIGTTPEICLCRGRTSDAPPNPQYKYRDKYRADRSDDQIAEPS